MSLPVDGFPGETEAEDEHRGQVLAELGIYLNYAGERRVG